MSGEYWLVAVQNPADSIRGALRRIDAAVHRGKGGKRLADVSYFAIPELKVGTVDQLMVLSDELARADHHVEGSVRKAERLYYETAGAATSGAAGGAGSSSAAPRSGASEDGDVLTVGSDSVQDYVRHFEWNVEQFDNREALPDLVKRMQKIVDKADADLRSFSSSYQEKKAALAGLNRKRGGNLSVGNLDDVLTPELVGPDVFVDTEYLRTAVVVIPATAEERFLEVYESIDNTEVPFGPAEDRYSVLGSPVVPGTATRITADKDGFVLYTVVVLRKYYDGFCERAREQRFTVRDFQYDLSRASNDLDRLAEAEAKAKGALAQLRAQCRRKFSQLFSIWLHVKAIRVFVESVLRYGLPVNFVCALLKPRDNAEAALHEALKAEYGDAAGGFDDFMSGGDDFGGASLAAMGGMGGAEADYYPYVHLSFSLMAR